jgi:prevent-host-death family protein
MKAWALQDAKAHFSQVVRAAKQAPQSVTIHGAPAVVIMSVETYQGLLTPSTSFAAFIRQSPLIGVELDLSREDSSARDIDL